MKLGLIFVFLLSSLAAAQLDGKTTIKLDVVGGTHEGHYEAETNICMYDHSWTVELLASMENPLEGLETLSLLIPDADNLTAFTFVVGFGDYFSPYVGYYTEYGVDPVNGLGTGSVQIEREGDHALLTVMGETADGVALTATLECFSLLDMTTY
jgi:hypothetical protein